MKSILLCLLVSCSLLAQNPLVITIDSLKTAADNVHERKFMIYYTIKNVSDAKVSFFLNPDMFIPSHGGPLKSAVFYKIFQEDELIEASAVLGVRIDTVAATELFQRYKHDSQTMDDFLAELEIRKEKMRQNFLKTYMTLNPGELRTFSKDLYWSRSRYLKQGDNEYYLDPLKQHFVQLMLIFWREEYEPTLTPEQFSKVMADESLIKGWFVSNKMAIDFSE